ncbi:hypothetical protein TUM4438_44000 [Shewanella sairae]|uniref:Uncharacterized protein n=1 Tax=Shewanella sairae TaxID=190310 RepID=A0ABQ4PRK4_9GAMM|nr:hypothetical protein [Shewanella sairae]MCL1132497.1 hypothetical protein [Shewanella sairae]GIU52122.1 hypothetical protein TUM4438_44000 [Shewanella sairae]
MQHANLETLFSTIECDEHCSELPPLSSYDDANAFDFEIPDGQAYTVVDETKRLKKARKAKRDKVNAEIQETADRVHKSGKAVGFQAKVASFSGFKSARLPDYVKTLLRQAKVLPHREEFLEHSDGLYRGTLQDRSKVILSLMLSAFVVNCNIANGMIVIATRKDGKNLTHDELRMEVALRHGVYIAESTWYFYINKLVQCGYLQSDTVAIYEDGHAAMFHAEASYKVLSKGLLDMLGASRLSVRNGAAKHEADLKAKGKSFKQKPRYPNSRYRMDGTLRKNMKVVEPCQRLLELITSHHVRETYHVPPN